jgi:hypothetical protein
VAGREEEKPSQLDDSKNVALGLTRRSPVRAETDEAEVKGAEVDSMPSPKIDESEKDNCWSQLILSLPWWLDCDCELSRREVHGWGLTWDWHESDDMTLHG